MNINDKVKFTTPGRFPRDYTGTVQSISSAFLEVLCEDGKTRKVRPATAKPA